MNDLESIFSNDVFLASYADDSYVGISFEVADFEASLNKISSMMNSHFEFLKSKGMICNSSKTELVLFNRWGDLSVKIPKHNIESVSKMKILGFQFTYNLDWNDHINTTFNKVNSLSYVLRYINSKLLRPHFKRLIHAHVISRLSYGSQLWSECTSFNLAQKAKSCYFKFLRLYARDFQKKFSFKSLLETSGMHSLDSIFCLQACRTLHSICFNMSPFQLATSVIARGYYNDRHRNRLFFARHNSKKVGINSFTNRLHLLTDDMNFEWLCLDPGEFDREIKERITCF